MRIQESSRSFRFLGDDLGRQLREVPGGPAFDVRDHVMRAGGNIRGSRKWFTKDTGPTLLQIEACLEPASEGDERLRIAQRDRKA